MLLLREVGEQIAVCCLLKETSVQRSKTNRVQAKMWLAFVALALGVKIYADLFAFNKGLGGGHVQVKSTQCFSEFVVEIRRIQSRALSFLESLLCWQLLRAVFTFLYRHSPWIYTLTASMRTGGMSLRPDSISFIQLPQKHWQS